jgi:hypothetical protein
MVGGAAYYAGRKVAQGDQRESEQEMRLQQLEAQQAAPPPQQYAPPPPQYAPALAATPPAPAAPTQSPAEQLMDLKKLLDAGALTQEEFEVEKAKVLRGV